MLPAWIKRMTGAFGMRKRTLEDNVLDLLKENPQVYVHPAIDFFKKAPTFAGSGRDYYSASGRVHVCMDIYGPEVKLDGGNELLDCTPDYYGLTPDEGKELYNAILSCVPGTCFHADRMMEERNAQS